MLAFRSLTQSLIELGQASEEIFRGDRLPILNFPEPDDQAIDNWALVRDRVAIAYKYNLARVSRWRSREAWYER